MIEKGFAVVTNGGAPRTLKSWAWLWWQEGKMAVSWCLEGASGVGIGAVEGVKKGVVCWLLLLVMLLKDKLLLQQLLMLLLLLLLLCGR